MIPSGTPNLPTYPLHHMGDKDAPIKETLVNAAEDWKSPIGMTCLSVVYRSIPPEWFERDPFDWPDEPPEGCPARLKEELLTSKEVQEEKIEILDEALLNKMLAPAYVQLAAIVAKAVPDSRPLLAAKEPFNLGRIIRTNIEAAHVMDWDKLTELLLLLTPLMNQQTIEEEDLHLFINIVRASCLQPEIGIAALARPGDQLGVFALQLSSRTDMEYLFSLFEYCSKDDALDALDDVVQRSGTITMPEEEDTQPLSTLIWDLHRLCGENRRDFISLFSKLVDYVEDFQGDHIDINRKLTFCSILRGCGDAIHGLNLNLQAIHGYREIVANFAVNSRFSAFEAFADFLSARGISIPLGERLYKSWWFNHRDSLAKRVTDWWMHNCLVKEKRLGLTEEVAVDLVKAWVHTHAPYLPFMEEQARLTYHRIHNVHQQLLSLLN